MARVKGKVYKVFEKEWSGNGKSTVLRSIKLEDNPIYYRWGSKPVPAGVVGGAFIEFEAMAKDDKSAQINGEIVVRANPPAEQNASPAQDPDGAPPQRTNSSWAAKDDSIRYQSSRKDALAFLALPGVLENIAGKAKPADKLGIIEATLDRYTAAFFEDVATFGAVTRANAVETEPTSGADEEDEE